MCRPSLLADAQYDRVAVAPVDLSMTVSALGMPSFRYFTNVQLLIFVSSFTEEKLLITTQQMLFQPVRRNGSLNLLTSRSWSSFSHLIKDRGGWRPIHFYRV